MQWYGMVTSSFSETLKQPHLQYSHDTLVHFVQFIELSIIVAPSTGRSRVKNRPSSISSALDILRNNALSHGHVRLSQ